MDQMPESGAPRLPVEMWEEIGKHTSTFVVANVLGRVCKDLFNSRLERRDTYCKQLESRSTPAGCAWARGIQDVCRPCAGPAPANEELLRAMIARMCVLATTALDADFVTALEALRRYNANGGDDADVDEKIHMDESLPNPMCGVEPMYYDALVAGERVEQILQLCNQCRERPFGAHELPQLRSAVWLVLEALRAAPADQADILHVYNQLSTATDNDTIGRLCDELEAAAKTAAHVHGAHVIHTRLLSNIVARTALLSRLQHNPESMYVRLCALDLVLGMWRGRIHTSRAQYRISDTGVDVIYRQQCDAQRWWGFFHHFVYAAPAATTVRLLPLIHAEVSAMAKRFGMSTPLSTDEWTRYLLTIPLVAASVGGTVVQSMLRRA